MEFADQLGNVLKFVRPPCRIVSLVPSQTEFLWDIGVRRELVGATKFCVHPPGLDKSLIRVGGTKKVNLDVIEKLDPDLIIGNKEENDQEQIRVLQQKFPVWMSDICTSEDAFGMMSTLGTITGHENQTAALVSEIRRSLDTVRFLFNCETVAYFIWNRPYMFAGKNTFIDHILTHLGLQNVAGSLERYPQLDIDDLRNAMPRYCFLSSEPYPFKKVHAEMISRLLPETKVVLVDGEIFSWYGSRLLRLPEYVLTLRETLRKD